MNTLKNDKLNVIFSKINKCYGIEINSFEELKLGASKETLTYQIVNGKMQYFIKIRLNFFNELSIVIPNLLVEEKNIENIIKPIKILDGKLYIKHSSSYICLYPFIKGNDCWNYNLSKEQWKIFGSVLYIIHNTNLPNNILKQLPKETYSSQSREYVYNILNRIEERKDILTKEYFDFLIRRREIINKMIHKAENKSEEIKKLNPNNCLCHGDIHAGNIMLNKYGKIFLVDWDTIIYAPKERDLMFIGGGIGNKWNTLDEINNFYHGYKNDRINEKILSYYRFERIIEDIEDYDYQLIDPSTTTDEKTNIVNTLESQFIKNDVVDIAFQMDTKK